jgi:hypothetical protein
MLIFRGVPYHGDQREGLFEAGNISVLVVASEALAERILEWVAREIEPTRPVMAWTTDVMALPGKHFA